MTYGAFESSPDSGSPVELYVFRVGLQTFYYTSANIDLTIPPDTYISEPIKRSRIDLTAELNKQNINVEVVRSNVIAEFFRFAPPDAVVSLTLLRMHEQDPDQETVVAWMGRVLSVRWKNLIAELYCEPVSTSLRRSGLRRRYQRNCPHQLYEAASCGVNRTDFRFQGQVSSVIGLDVMVPGAGGQPDGYYSGGYVEWIDESGLVNTRTIESQVGDTLTILISSFGLSTGTEVGVYAGCAHTIDVCDSDFNNSGNYGGTTLYQPPNNPFDSKVF